MIGWVFSLIIAWHAGLLLLLLVFALRTDDLLRRLMAFDALSVVFLSVLTVLAIHRRDTVYLDIGLVVAMLVFVQTVAAARLIRRRSIPE